MSAKHEEFNKLFNAVSAAKSAAPSCANALCDRRPASGSRFCGCCRDDRAAGRKVIAGSGEILPFDDRLGRTNSSGPCLAMTRGDCAVRESVAFTDRQRRNDYGGKGSPWAGDPKRKTAPRHVN